MVIGHFFLTNSLRIFINKKFNNIIKNKENKLNALKKKKLVCENYLTYYGMEEVQRGDFISRIGNYELTQMIKVINFLLLSVIGDLVMSISLCSV